LGLRRGRGVRPIHSCHVRWGAPTRSRTGSPAFRARSSPPMQRSRRKAVEAVRGHANLGPDDVHVDRFPPKQGNQGTTRFITANLALSPRSSRIEDSHVQELSGMELARLAGRPPGCDRIRGRCRRQTVRVRSRLSERWATPLDAESSSQQISVLTSTGQCTTPDVRILSHRAGRCRAWAVDHKRDQRPEVPSPRCLRSSASFSP
jgi:hypothetical protein